MEIGVLLENDWEWECCGSALEVGKRVTMSLFVPRHAHGYGDDIRYIESNHEEDSVEVTGWVTSIRAFESRDGAASDAAVDGSDVREIERLPFSDFGEFTDPNRNIDAWVVRFEVDKTAVLPT